MKSVVVILVNLTGLISAASWSYDYQTQWPDKCTKGTQQSPINILSEDAHVDRHGAHIRGPLVFRGYGNVYVHAENNGHTLKWSNVKGTTAPVLSGGPLRGNYTFLQFHLHWLSEHAIDGMKYPLEIHMVHIKTGLTVEEALKRDDGLAVVGVLCQLHDDLNSEFALQEIAAHLPKLFDRTDQPTNASTIDLSRLFSPEPQSFYTYHGSLTTPGCEEVVTWIVMDKPLAISHDQYSLFTKVDIGHGRLDNYRNLQHVNRMVYRSVASCSSMLAPSFLILLASAVNCFASNLSAMFSKGFCVVSNVKRKLFGYNLKECAKYVQ